MMNIYLISQNKNVGYDTYDSAVVAAETAEAARCTHPRHDAAPDYPTLCRWNEDACCWETRNNISGEWYADAYLSDDWVNPVDVTVTLIGTAVDETPACVICASFNAG